MKKFFKIGNKLSQDFADLHLQNQLIFSETTFTELDPEMLAGGGGGLGTTLEHG